MRNDMNALAPLEDLLHQVRRLRPCWDRPELFHIAKSDVISSIRSIIARGSAAAEQALVRPGSVSTLTPGLPAHAPPPLPELPVTITLLPE
jgi:hypothetical protein